MEISKILADGYGGTTLLGTMTSAELDRPTDDCRAEQARVVGRGRGRKTAVKNRPRRRRRSLASRNLDEIELQMLRQKINGRERQRMHDLNSALDALREVGPM